MGKAEALSIIYPQASRSRRPRPEFVRPGRFGLPPDPAVGGHARLEGALGIFDPEGHAEHHSGPLFRHVNVPWRELRLLIHPGHRGFEGAVREGVDDIISTARTMIASVGHLERTGMRPPVCVGVHAVFAGSAYEDLLAAGAGRVVTCNTIPHASNAIDITGIFVESVRAFVSANDRPRRSGG